MAVEGVGLAGAAPVLAVGVELVEHPLRDQRLVDGLFGPDPFLRPVDRAVPGSARAPVEHLVAGVLRVTQQIGHGRLPPGPPRPVRPADRLGRRVAFRVGVERVGDRAVAELPVVAPVRDLRHRLPPGVVGFEAGLRRSPVGLRRVRVPVVLRPVAVGRLADVPAVPDVGAQPSPAAFEGLEGFVFGYGLVDPPVQDRRGPRPVDLDRLVPRQQRHPGLFELAFDREVFVHPPGDPRHRLADHRIEPAVPMLGLGQQVVDPAVAGDRDVEPGHVRAVAALIEFFAARFHVVKVCDVHPGLRQRGLRPLQLADHRLAGVLLLLGRGPPGERDPDLPLQPGQRHRERRRPEMGGAPERVARRLREG